MVVVVVVVLVVDVKSDVAPVVVLWDADTSEIDGTPAALLIKVRVTEPNEVDNNSLELGVGCCDRVDPDSIFPPFL